MRFHKTTTALVTIALGAALERPASAGEDSVPECLQSYERAQVLTDEHKLTEARAMLVSCAKDSCPAVLRKDCMEWLRSVEGRLPTVVFRVVDEAERDLVSAKILVDDKPVDQPMGVAIVFDPGPHAVRVEAEGKSPLEQNIVLSEGEKNRSIVLRLSPDPDRGASTAGETRAPGTRSRGVPVLSYVLGGVGVAALGAFGYLGLTGDSDYRALERGCGRTGACSADDVDDVRTRLRIADVALGVGVVSLAAAVVVYLVRPQANTSYARAAPALRW